MLEAEPLELAQPVAGLGRPVAGRPSRSPAHSQQRGGMPPPAPSQTQRIAPLVLPVPFLVPWLSTETMAGGARPPQDCAARAGCEPCRSDDPLVDRRRRRRRLAIADDIGIAQPFCRSRAMRRFVAGVDQRQRAVRARPRRRRRAPRSARPRGRPDGPHGGGRRRARPRPGPGRGRRPLRTWPARGECTGRTSGCRRQVACVALEQVARAAQRARPCGRSAPRRRRRPGPPPPRLRPASASGASPARASASPHSARITSRSCGCAGSPCSMAMALADLDRVAGTMAEALAHVGDQGHGRQAGAVRHADDAARPAPRACSCVGMKAPEPILTSMTSACRPPASFLARIEAVISGMLSTVAVTSRMRVEAAVGRARDRRSGR